MVGLILCVLALVLTVVAGRRSLLLGLCATVTVGYAYGILRAITATPASHFIFDFAVLGLYGAQLFRAPGVGEQRAPSALRSWVMVLSAWPILLLAVPTQDVLVQFVGLRAAIFILPFVLFGARLTAEDAYGLALWCAVLNIGAFAVGAAEFTLGLDRILPHNAVTALNFQQHDAGGVAHGQAVAYRIPSTFPTSHAYGGAMVVTLPLLLGAWSRRKGVAWHRPLLIVGMVATGLGVFLSASRTHALVLFVLLGVALLSGRVRMVHRLGAVLAVMVVGGLVARESRLQRFATLQDTAYVTDRVGSSVHQGLFELLAERPMGNGLGGGGTNMPYFLQSRVRHFAVVENEYAKIVLEQGFPGLVLWVVFLGWMFARRAGAPTDPWHLGRRLAWWAGVVYFGTAWIGLGMLTAIPQSALLLLTSGWMFAGRAAAGGRLPAAARRSEPQPALFLPQPEASRASA